MDKPLHSESQYLPAEDHQCQTKVLLTQEDRIPIYYKERPSKPSPEVGDNFLIEDMEEQ